MSLLAIIDTNLVNIVDDVRFKIQSLKIQVQNKRLVFESKMLQQKVWWSDYVPDLFCEEVLSINILQTWAILYYR